VHRKAFLVEQNLQTCVLRNLEEERRKNGRGRTVKEGKESKKKNERNGEGEK
jgi:hypothetical protein